MWFYFNIVLFVCLTALFDMAVLARCKKVAEGRPSGAFLLQSLVYVPLVFILGKYLSTGTVTAVLHGGTPYPYEALVLWLGLIWVLACVRVPTNLALAVYYRRRELRPKSPPEQSSE